MVAVGIELASKHPVFEFPFLRLSGVRGGVCEQGDIAADGGCGEALGEGCSFSLGACTQLGCAIDDAQFEQDCLVSGNGVVARFPVEDEPSVASYGGVDPFLGEYQRVAVIIKEPSNAEAEAGRRDGLYVGRRDYAD